MACLCNNMTYVTLDLYEFLNETTLMTYLYFEFSFDLTRLSHNVSNWSNQYEALFWLPPFISTNLELMFLRE